MAEAERTLEQVLRRWPEHPGANHYYIHAVESSQTPERAVPSAQRLMGVVPSAGHMVHMPAHIWLVLGDYELAATVNERAGQVDREYFAASNVRARYNVLLRPQSALRDLRAIHAGPPRGDCRRRRKRSARRDSYRPRRMPEMADAFLAVALLTQVRRSSLG